MARRLRQLLCGLILALWLFPVSAAEHGSIELSLTTHLGDRQGFVEGDEISFFLSLDRAAFVYLFYLDAGSNLLQLLPNRHMPNHYFENGMFLPVPSEEQPFRFKVGPPFGREIMFAFASDNGQLEFAGELLDNGLKRLDYDIDRLKQMLRQDSNDRFGYAELRLHTSPAVSAN